MSYRCVLLIVAIALAVPAEGAELGVSFTPTTVVVKTATPSHQVVVFAIGIGSRGRAALLTREALEETSDGTGVATFTPRRIPPRSVWVAVDVTDGTFGIASPSGELPALLPLAADAWQTGRATVDVTRRFLEVLLVRPGAGAWTLQVTDGGPKDDDARLDGTSRLRLDKMGTLVGDSAAPAVAVQDDVLVIVDPQTLRYFVGGAP